MENSYILSTEEALKYFGVSEDSGLSLDQAQALRERYGSNALPEDPPTPLWQLVLEQFKDQL
ncbi:MAG: Sarcoplasmic/endoplasmic reticulum calcium ATPase 2, partial [Pleopsidium flavum]